MTNRKFLVIGAVLAALAGAALVLLYARGADARAESRYETVQVLRAIAPIEPGESIASAAQSGKLSLSGVQSDQVLPNSLNSIDTLGKQVALVKIYPGEQIVTDKFGGIEDVDVPTALPIPKGQLAISVNLTDTARVAGFVNPGSQVAVFVNSTDDDGKPQTRLLLDRVTVIGVGSTTPTTTTVTDETGQQTTEALPRTLMTLALDQKDAERVLFASSNGELAFGLLTPDSTVAPAKGVSADSLF